MTGHTRYSSGSAPVQSWEVEVRVNGRDVLTLGSSHLSGIPNIDDYADVIEKCAANLLSFIGRPGGAAQASRYTGQLPPVNEIRKLIDDFISPDLDTEKAFASHRRAWMVQCLQAVLVTWPWESREASPVSSTQGGGK